MSRGVGIAKRGFGRALSRTGYSAGGEVMDDMSEGHESMESLKEEAKETKLEKEGYKETKAGKMIKDFAKGVKEGVKNTYEQAKNWVTSLVSDAAVSQKLNTTQTSDNVAESSSSSIASFFQDGSIKVNDGVKIADGVTKFGKGEIQSAIDSKTGQMFTFDKADYLVASTNEPKEVDIMPTPMAQPSSLNIPPVSQTTTSAPPTVVNVDNSDIVEALKSANRPIILQIGKEEIARAMTGPILTEAKNSSIRF